MAELETMFSFLDLPPEAHALQDDYWRAEREWETKRVAFETVLAEILKERGE